MLDYRPLLTKYRIPLSSLGKEVLVDEELLEEFAEHGDVVFPYAFPGLVFNYVGGVAADEGKKAEALKEEYGVDVLDDPSSFPPGENLFLEAPARAVRDVIIRGVLLGFDRIYGVVRESVGIEVTAEPGWKEYSYLTAFVNAFYDVEDAFRLRAQDFYPHPRGSMAGIVLKKKGEYGDRQGFLAFLRRVFTHKNRKLSAHGISDDRRPFEVPADELLEIYETTGR